MSSGGVQRERVSPSTRFKGRFARLHNIIPLLIIRIHPCPSPAKMRWYPFTLPFFLGALASSPPSHHHRPGADPSSSPRTIVLLGDSLINRPWNEHNLSSKIFALLPPTPFNLSLINAGNNGEEVASTLARTPAMLQQYKPWGVLWFWDSDCSNIDESTMTPQQVAALRANYSLHVTQTAALIQASGARLAVAGPELLGEGPLGLQPRFQNKTAAYMEAYVNLTREAAERVEGVSYINMRAAFLQAIPWWWQLYAGWVTLEGEHPNERGAGVEAELFANTLGVWFTAEEGRNGRQ